MRAPRFSSLLAAAKLWNSPPAASRLPVRSLLEERVGAGIAGFSVLFVFLVAAWGVGGPFPDGHFASAANIGTAGFNMVLHHSIYPIVPYLDRAPTAANYYMHHPLGVFWMDALLIKLLGAHDWVLRLPAIAYVTLTAFFLYRAGRAIWGPIEGALSAFGYVALPITLGFANYHDMEQPLMFGCVVATWGYIRFRQTERDAYALASVAGFSYAIIHDWEAYIWGASFLVFLFVRGFLIPARWLGPVADGKKFGRYWAMMSGAAVLILAITIKLVISSDKLSDLMGMYGLRTSGSAAPLSTILESRHVRIELMFTGLGIALGKLAAPVILLRFFVRRDEGELLPAFLLLTAVAYYLIFTQGAGVHIFWPHPFATYFGLALGALAATVRDGWTWLAPRLRARATAAARWLPAAAGGPWVALALVGLPALLVFRDGASLIRMSRESGGRFIEFHLQSDIDRNLAMRWFLRRSFPSPTEKVGYHTSISATWDTQWEVRPRPSYPRQQIVTGNPPFTRVFLVDTRFASVADLQEAARRYHVYAVGWHWLMDRGAPAGPLEGFSFDEHDPNLFESFWHGATEPVRQVVPDPWVTWEWRTLLGQAATPPTGKPRTLEQLRVAHNVALAGGDTAGAARFRAELVKGLDLPATAVWDNGTQLLGVAHHTGAARSLTPYFLAGTFTGSPKPAVRAKVTGRRFLSTLPVDPTEADIAYPPPQPCEMWRPGHIYSVQVVYRHRPGHEKLELSFVPVQSAKAPNRVGGPPWIPLLTL